MFVIGMCMGDAGILIFKIEEGTTLSDGSFQHFADAVSLLDAYILLENLANEGGGVIEYETDFLVHVKPKKGAT